MRVFSARMAGLVGITLAGCKGYMDLGDWPTDAGGGTGGISISDGSVSSGGGDTCSGTCRPLPDGPVGEENFVLLWLGPLDQALPGCPTVAPSTEVSGLTDLGGTAPAECAPCSCQPPKGSCELPTTLSAYFSPVCPAPTGAPFQSFNVEAPIPWDGQCNKDNPIAGVPNCGGPQCIQSLTVEPPVVHDPPTCEPTLPPPPKIETPYWGHRAVACTGTHTGDCEDHGEFCDVPAPAGWLECILREGADLPCYGKWSDKHVIYRDPTITDMRSCAECTCGAPVGSKCSTSVSVYTDACCGCNDPGAPALWSLTVDSTVSNCGGVPSGSALGSKEATPPVYQPGQCAPSGPPDHNDPIGEATADDPHPDSEFTMCCRTNDVPR
jgi:hypothetical protein